MCTEDDALEAAELVRSRRNGTEKRKLLPLPTFSPALATERVSSIARGTFYRSSTKTAMEDYAEISAILS